MFTVILNLDEQSNNLKIFKTQLKNMIFCRGKRRKTLKFFWNYKIRQLRQFVLISVLIMMHLLIGALFHLVLMVEFSFTWASTRFLADIKNMQTPNTSPIVYPLQLRYKETIRENMSLNFILAKVKLFIVFIFVLMYKPRTCKVLCLIQEANL